MTSFSVTRAAWRDELGGVEVKEEGTPGPRDEAFILHATCDCLAFSAQVRLRRGLHWLRVLRATSAAKLVKIPLLD